MFSRSFWLSREVFIGLAALLVVAVPVIVFGDTKVIYVDHDASGTKNGSSEHPYGTISEALKHADSGTEVHVRSGEYKENITIPKDVKVMGNSKDRGKVVIKADKTDQAAVEMRHDSELMHVVVDGGRYGVKVMDDSQAHLYNVSVKNSRGDGIHIESASKDKKYQTVLDHVHVHDNNRAGVYSEKRNIVIIESEIYGNGTDGIDLAADTKAWIEHTDITSNRGSGMRLILDESDVWTKSNNIRGNAHEGIEVDSYGVAGNIGIKKTDLIGNGHYGVARIARTASSYSAFGGLIIGTDINANTIDRNLLGGVSSIIRGF